ncbi:MAG: lipid A biosynthesis lauroyl acyltransferase [Legionellales bacterium]|nr:lipid A biosynthesis lauroyl acyltransferase [Legionellales bacterium]|tara:strand:- start:38622 stop:39563 length:942 start_codon:yes stop_codon:yes gene_type:complete
MVKKPPSLFNPLTWPLRLIYRLLIPLAWLPYSLQLRWGRRLGRFLQKRMSRSVNVADTNLRLCFPNMPQTERQALLDKHFEALGISVFEIIMAGYIRKKPLKNLLHSVTGFEHIDEALQQGNGAVLLFPHMMSIYLAGRLLLNYSPHPFSLMYHTPSEPILNARMWRILNKYTDKVFTRDDFKDMLRHLKNNNIVWYAPDMDLGRKMSEFVPFFGVPAATSVATTKVAKITKAKIIPIGFKRRDDGKGYDIAIQPPLPGFPSGDDRADALQINQAVEAIVKQAPEQYLWVYKRFNTRPQGEEKVYKKKPATAN